MYNWQDQDDSFVKEEFEFTKINKDFICGIDANA